MKKALLIICAGAALVLAGCATVNTQPNDPDLLSTQLGLDPRFPPAPVTPLLLRGS